jgi:hypothetical protein
MVGRLARSIAAIGVAMFDDHRATSRSPWLTALAMAMVRRGIKSGPY